MDRNNTNSMRELVADSVISILETTAADGKTYKTQYYNLDAIIAVDYRQPVNSSLRISAIQTFSLIYRQLRYLYVICGIGICVIFLLSVLKNLTDPGTGRDIKNEMETLQKSPF